MPLINLYLEQPAALFNLFDPHSRTETGDNLDDEQ